MNFYIYQLVFLKSCRERFLLLWQSGLSHVFTLNSKIEIITNIKTKGDINSFFFFFATVAEIQICLSIKIHLKSGCVKMKYYK